MSYTSLSRSGALTALVLGTVVIALTGNSLRVNAEVVFTKTDQAEQGMTLQKGKDTIFYCAKKDGATPTFPLMNTVLKNNATVHFSISEYTAQATTQQTKMYISGGLTNSLTAFERGKLYVVRTDTDLRFRCNEGLSTVDAGGIVAPEWKPPVNPTSSAGSNGQSSVAQSQTSNVSSANQSSIGVSLPSSSSTQTNQTSSVSNTQPSSAPLSSSQATSVLSSTANSAMSVSNTNQPIQNPFVITFENPESEVTRGKAIIMKFSLQNKNPILIDKASVTLEMPEGYAIPVGVASGNCTGNGNTVQCTNLMIFGDGTMNFTFPFLALPNAACGQQQVRAVGLAHLKDLNDLPQTYSNYVSWNLNCDTPQGPDPLTLTLTGPEALQKNMSASYTLVIENTSQQTQGNISFSFPFPTGVSTDAVSTMGNCSITTTSMSCAGLQLQPGLSMSLTLPIRTLNTLPCEMIPFEAIGNIGGSTVIHSNILSVSGCDGVAASSAPASSSSSTQTSQASSGGSQNGPVISATLTGPDKLSKNALATYVLGIHNNTSDMLDNVQFQFVFPAGFTGNGKVNSPNCQVSSSDIKCTYMQIQPNLTLPLSLQFVTNNNLPCSNIPIKVTVKSGTTSVTSNTINVQGCPPNTLTILNSIATPSGYLPVNTTQTLQTSVIAFSTAFTDGTLHVQFPSGITPELPINSLNVGTCTTSENSVDCTGMSRVANMAAVYSFPFRVTANVPCGKQDYAVTLTYKDSNGVDQIMVKNHSMQLCTAASQNTGPVDGFAITAGNATCLTADCRTVKIPVTLDNKSMIIATNATFTASLDKTWGASVDGWNCMNLDSNTTNQRSILCPGTYYFAVPSQTKQTVDVVLKNSAPCPIANPRTTVLLQAAPSTIYEQEYSNNSFYATLPVPCQAPATSDMPIESVNFDATFDTATVILGRVPNGQTAVQYDIYKGTETMERRDGGTLQSGKVIQISGFKAQFDLEGGPGSYTIKFAACPPSTISTGSGIQEGCGPVFSKTIQYVTQNSSQQSSATSSVSSQTASSTAADSFRLDSIDIAGNWVTIQYEKHSSTCAHLLTPQGQLLLLQLCNEKGPIVIPRSQLGTFDVGQEFKLCHGNDANLCSASVKITETTGVPEEGLNDVYMRFPFEGQLGGPASCVTSDCRTVVVPTWFINKTSADAADVRIAAAVGAMWKTMSIKGMQCTSVNSLNADQNIFKCPGLTVPKNVSNYTVGIVLTSNVPCPVSNLNSLHAAFTGSWKALSQYPTDISTTVPLPCAVSASATSSAAQSSAGVNYETACQMNPAYCSSSSVASFAPTYSLTMTSVPPPPLNPLKDYTPVKIRMGETIIFTKNEQSVVSRGSKWRWDSLRLDCTGNQNSDGNTLSCKGLSAGMSTVSVVTFPISNQDITGIIESNVMSVFVDDNTNSSSTSSAPYKSPVCGNGKVEAFEICDDGNKIDTDTCKNNCTINFNPQICGNGIREGQEACDDGNQNDQDACSTKCTVLDYTPPAVTIENVSVRTERNTYGGGTLYISGNIAGTTNKETQRVILFINGVQVAAADSGPSFTVMTDIRYRTVYVPTLQVTERLSVYKTVTIGEKKLDPVTLEAPTPLFSTKDRYGLFVINQAISGNFKTPDPLIPGAFLTGWKAADQICNASAIDAGLSAPGTSIWHSTISNPHRQTFPLYNMRNELLAQTENDLWSLQRSTLPAKVTNALGFDTYGDVWTGSDGTGKVAQVSCSGWSTTQPPNRGSVGQINGSGGQWYQSALKNCSEYAYIYCVNDITQ